MELNKTEKFAEELEGLILQAQAKGINVFAFVHAEGQGGAYFAGDVKQTLELAKNTIDTTLDQLEKEDTTEETLREMGISYGL